MKKLSAFLKRNIAPILSFVIILAALAIIELFMGRSPLGPDGRFGWWDNNIWGNENSQRVADVYTFSHIAHGLIFFFLFWAFLKNKSLRYWFFLAVLLEAGWEILENSPLIIDRYRSATIAVSYEGDSVMNSVVDVISMAVGFWFAWKAPVWLSVTLLVVMEVGCLLWVRDNLTLNVLMLIYPFESIK